MFLGRFTGTEGNIQGRFILRIGCIRDAGSFKGIISSRAKVEIYCGAGSCRTTLRERIVGGACDAFLRAGGTGAIPLAYIAFLCIVLRADSFTGVVSLTYSRDRGSKWAGRVADKLILAGDLKTARHIIDPAIRRIICEIKTDNCVGH